MNTEIKYLNCIDTKPFNMRDLLSNEQVRWDKYLLEAKLKSESLYAELKAVLDKSHQDLSALFVLNPPAE